MLQTTLECLNNEELRVCVVGAQVCDVEQKIETAIEKSVRLYRDTMVTKSTAPIESIVAAPTMARLVCDVTLWAFGFGKVSEKESEEIMREVVWHNTDKFFYETLRILAVEVTTLAFLGPIALPIIAAETLLAVPRSVRVVVASACDVILILEHAFSVSGPGVWPAEFSGSANEYKAEGARRTWRSQSNDTNLENQRQPIPQGHGKIIHNLREGGKNKLQDVSEDE